MYDEANPRDMVEYHVLRDGCDEVAIAANLREHFANVETVTYWSTQARSLQLLGEKLKVKTTFAIVATHKQSR